MSRRENLHRLLNPRHVAFVGGREAEISIRQSGRLGFRGTIWPVNPRREEMAGLPCFTSVAELPEAPDAAFVAVPREATVDVVRDLATRGAGGCVCYAAGFAELDTAGAELQQALVDAAGDMALIGPNCYGVLNYLDGLALWPDQQGGAPIDRGIALIMQSGNMALNLTMQERSVPIALVLTVGNQAVLGIGDCLDAVIGDPRIAAIGLYIEGLDDIAGFSGAASRALQAGQPIVAIKSGRSDAGAKVALSHTNSLAGADEIYDALFDRYGIARVHTLPALLETLKVLTLTGPLPGNRLAAICCSGAEAALIADRAADLGIALPAPGPAQSDDLRGILSDAVTIANPLDFNTYAWGNRDLLQRSFTALMADQADLGMLILDYPRPGVDGIEGWHVALEALIGARQHTGTKALVVSTLPECLPANSRARAIENDVTPVQGLDEALTAVAGAARYGALQTRISRPGGRAPGALSAAGSGPAAPKTLDEWQSKRRLAEYGLRLPDGRLASRAELAEAAAAIGFPIVLKGVADDLAHKTEAGAVALNLRSAAEVEAAADAMPATVECFLVESMIGGGVAELIIGIKRDEQFGPVMVIGSGGRLVNLVEDSQIVLLPTDRHTIEAAIGRLKAARLLAGFRGAPKGDIDAVVDAALAVARFAEERRADLAELDVNPLIVLPAGQGAVAADALIRMQID